MSTRHAPAGLPLRQNRFASSAAHERGLLGNLVALRCATLEAREDRELVFWLQGISQTGGLESFAAEFLAANLDHLGTRSMRKFGVNPKVHYNAEQVRAIRRECEGLIGDEFLLKGEITDRLTVADLSGCSTEDSWEQPWREEDLAKANRRPTSYPVSSFMEICRKAAAKLESDLELLCLDPEEDFCLWYFHDLKACLREYQTEWSAQQLAGFRDGFASTALSNAIAREIDDVYEMGGTVLLHNSAGNGKSYAAQAYCAAHPGRARHCSVPATNDETGFLRAIADALGVASGLSFKAIQIRERILPVLRTGDIVLVLDSAQWLFPVSDYRYALPNRINWVLNELSEQRVPVVMFSDSKMFDTLGLVEARTGWNRSKFVNQLSRVVELPAALAKDDVQAVAAALLDDGDRAAQRKLADYMIVAQGYLHSGKPTAQRARRIAVAHKRDRVTLADMEEAIEGWMKPAFADMDAALKRADVAAAGSKSKVRNWRPDTAAQTAAKVGRRRNAIVTSSDLNRAAKPPVSEDIQPTCNRLERPVQGDSTGTENDFTHPRIARVPGESLTSPAELVG